MSDREFEPAGGETVYDGAIFTVRRERFRFADDGEVATRDVVRSPGAVAVVAHDGEHVVLVRQPREAIGGELLELPAGRLDEPGESPQEAAARELEEEVGLRAASYELLTAYYSTAGMTDEHVRIYLATGLEEVDDPASSGENERITVERHRIDALGDLIPTLQDAKTLIGLLLLRDRLRG